jgi:hypothetical protein
MLLSKLELLHHERLLWFDAFPKNDWSQQLAGGVQ